MTGCPSWKSIRKCFVLDPNLFPWNFHTLDVVQPTGVVKNIVSGLSQGPETFHCPCCCVTSSPATCFEVHSSRTCPPLNAFKSTFISLDVIPGLQKESEQFEEVLARYFWKLHTISVKVIVLATLHMPETPALLLSCPTFKWKNEYKAFTSDILEIHFAEFTRFFKASLIWIVNERN